VFSAALLLLGLAAAAPEPLVDAEPLVVLSEPVADIDPTASPPRLRVRVRARSSLDVPVDGVQVGLLFAETPEALQGMDPSRLYRQGAPSPEVGVVRHAAPIELPPRGVVTAAFDVAVPVGAPRPAIFVSHVLGYGLADVDAATLFALLGTRAAADEVAAVGAFGLTGDAAARAAARRRWAHKAALRADLAASLLAPIPPRPSQGEAFRRVFAVRALGVLGGPAAVDTLQELQRRPGLEAFDEPLQVLRIARVSGSTLETPLAFAVPETCRRMRDVVDAALADTGALDDVEPPPVAVAPVPPAPVEPPWWQEPQAWGVLVGGGVAAWLAMRIRRRLGAPA
jgi:hypothetical protein